MSENPELREARGRFRQECVPSGRIYEPLISYDRFMRARQEPESARPYLARAMRLWGEVLWDYLLGGVEAVPGGYDLILRAQRAVCDAMELDDAAAEAERASQEQGERARVEQRLALTEEVGTEEAAQPPV